MGAGSVIVLESYAMGERYIAYGGCFPGQLADAAVQRAMLVLFDLLVLLESSVGNQQSGEAPRLIVACWSELPSEVGGDCYGMGQA